MNNKEKKDQLKKMAPFLALGIQNGNITRLPPSPSAQEEYKSLFQWNTIKGLTFSMSEVKQKRSHKKTKVMKVPYVYHR